MTTIDKHVKQMSLNEDGAVSSIQSCSHFAMDHYEKLPWLHTIHKKYIELYIADNTKVPVILYLFDDYLRHVKENSRCGPARAIRLADDIIKFIESGFAMMEQFSFVKCDTFYIKIKRLLSLYCELELKGTAKSDRSGLDIATRIAVNLKVFMKDSAHFTPLDILIGVPFAIWENPEIVRHLFKTFLCCKTSFVPLELPDELYIKHLILFKIWRHCERDLEKRNEVDDLFLKNVKPKPSLGSNSKFSPFIPLYNPNLDNDHLKLLRSQFPVSPLRNIIINTKEIDSGNQDVIQSIVELDLTEDDPEVVYIKTEPGPLKALSLPDEIICIDTDSDDECPPNSDTFYLLETIKQAIDLRSAQLYCSTQNHRSVSDYFVLEDDNVEICKESVSAVDTIAELRATEVNERQSIVRDIDKVSSKNSKNIEIPTDLEIDCDVDVSITSRDEINNVRLRDEYYTDLGDDAMISVHSENETRSKSPNDTDDAHNLSDSTTSSIHLNRAPTRTYGSKKKKTDKNLSSVSDNDDQYEDVEDIDTIECHFRTIHFSSWLNDMYKTAGPTSTSSTNRFDSNNLSNRRLSLHRDKTLLGYSDPSYSQSSKSRKRYETHLRNRSKSLDSRAFENYPRPIIKSHRMPVYCNQTIRTSTPSFKQSKQVKFMDTKTNCSPSVALPSVTSSTIQIRKTYKKNPGVLQTKWHSCPYSYVGNVGVHSFSGNLLYENPTPSPRDLFDDIQSNSIGLPHTSLNTDWNRSYKEKHQQSYYKPHKLKSSPSTICNINNAESHVFINGLYVNMNDIDDKTFKASVRLKKNSSGPYSENNTDVQHLLYPRIRKTRAISTFSHDIPRKKQKLKMKEKKSLHTYIEETDIEHESLSTSEYILKDSAVKSRKRKQLKPSNQDLPLREYFDNTSMSTDSEQIPNSMAEELQSILGLIKPCRVVVNDCSKDSDKLESPLDNENISTYTDFSKCDIEVSEVNETEKMLNQTNEQLLSDTFDISTIGNNYKPYVLLTRMKQSFIDAIIYPTILSSPIDLNEAKTSANCNDDNTTLNLLQSTDNLNKMNVNVDQHVEDVVGNIPVLNKTTEDTKLLETIETNQQEQIQNDLSEVSCKLSDYQVQRRRSYPQELIKNKSTMIEPIVRPKSAMSSPGIEAISPAKVTKRRATTSTKIIANEIVEPKEAALDNWMNDESCSLRLSFSMSNLCNIRTESPAKVVKRRATTSTKIIANEILESKDVVISNWMGDESCSIRPSSSMSNLCTVSAEPEKNDEVNSAEISSKQKLEKFESKKTDTLSSSEIADKQKDETAEVRKNILNFARNEIKDVSGLLTKDLLITDTMDTSENEEDGDTSDHTGSSSDTPKGNCLINADHHQDDSNCSVCAGSWSSSPEIPELDFLQSGTSASIQRFQLDLDEEKAQKQTTTPSGTSASIQRFQLDLDEEKSQKQTTTPTQKTVRFSEVTQMYSPAECFYSPESRVSSSSNTSDDQSSPNDLIIESLGTDLWNEFETDSMLSKQPCLLDELIDGQSSVQTKTINEKMSDPPNVEAGEEESDNIESPAYEECQPRRKKNRKLNRGCNKKHRSTTTKSEENEDAKVTSSQELNDPIEALDSSKIVDSRVDIKEKSNESCSADDTISSTIGSIGSSLTSSVNRKYGCTKKGNHKNYRLGTSRVVKDIS